MRNVTLRSLLALLLLLVPALASAQSVCLPKSVVQKDADGRLPTLDLRGGATPTFCASNPGDPPSTLGCWTIAGTKGALTRSSATSLRGQSIAAVPDASGCIDGYCAPLLYSPASVRLVAASADSAHVVVQDEKSLHVFDEATKARIASIALSDETAPPESNVTNQPVRLLFVAGIIYVAGSDAGPFIAVWRFRTDGTRLGRINRPGSAEAFNVFAGAVTIFDDKHIALTDAGLRHMALIPRAGGGGRLVTRVVRHAPCTRLQMETMSEGDLNLSGACRKVVRLNFEPFFGAPLVGLPSRDVLALLSGPQQGRIAILRGGDLTEIRRATLRICP
jgi:hypothetical protein